MGIDFFEHNEEKNDKKNYCDCFCAVFGAEMLTYVSLWSQSFHKLEVPARCLHTKKNPKKLETWSLPGAFRCIIMVQARIYVQIKTWTSAPSILTGSASLHLIISLSLRVPWEKLSSLLLCAYPEAPLKPFFMFDTWVLVLLLSFVLSHPFLLQARIPVSICIKLTWHERLDSRIFSGCLYSSTGSGILMTTSVQVALC